MYTSPRTRPAIWLWPNLLGLDAPVVALTWQAFLAACFALPLRLEGRIVLGLTVWAIYLTDRLLDVRMPAQEYEAERHRFHRRHKWLLSLLLAVALGADAAAVLFWLRPQVIGSGLLPLSGVLLYLGVLHRQQGPRRLPKEVIVALLFTAGTFLIGFTFATQRTMLLMPAFSFLILCLANLVAIELWEWRELRHSAGKRPHPWTIRLGDGLRPGMMLLSALALIIGGTWYFAVAMSALGIAVLHGAGDRISIPARRVLVDVALLTPLFWIVR